MGIFRDGALIVVLSDSSKVLLGQSLQNQTRLSDFSPGQVNHEPQEEEFLLPGEGKTKDWYDPEGECGKTKSPSPQPQCH